MEIIMKAAIAIIMTTIFSSSVFAFNSVTEILPSGKLLICKESGQVRKGNIVEVYTKEDPRSRSNKKTIKTSEIKLPEVGQKVKLTHKDFHPKGKNSVYHTEELGTAVVSGESLEGEDRVTYALDNSRYSRRIEKKIKISKEEAMNIQKDCLVAVPENGLVLKERAFVFWE
jgi:hypothetical protein